MGFQLPHYLKIAPISQMLVITTTIFAFNYIFYDDLFFPSMSGLPNDFPQDIFLMNLANSIDQF
jgi:hypothetical protein